MGTGMHRRSCLGQLHAGGHLVGVVQDVEVRQRGALGVPGGAAGELDIDHILGA